MLNAGQTTNFIYQIDGVNLSDKQIHEINNIDSPRGKVQERISTIKNLGGELNFYNQNDFEDYLFKNTKLETASTSRHKFGFVYEENGQQFFNLNLQIRFL